MSEKPKEIKIRFPENLQGGAYANNMALAFTKEEFIMDFMLVAPPAGSVTSRVIISPGHIKRIIKALQNSVDNYEKKFGKFEEAKEPTGKIGIISPPAHTA
ncbi:MAG: DUF3467 domain-containing protein [Candidatus Stahlbacteria bacterium]|nr:MAG: DUF3467 domain-containing protein [Candidatus Stahlbacteria bacterium]